jgi:hypothetical protein
VLVRGLPNFTTTYNGREIFTAETRVVALQDFPSSNIAALEVFKTSTAEPGRAGPRRPDQRPLAPAVRLQRDRQIAGSVWGALHAPGRRLTPNFNLLATKRWDLGDGGEIGVAAERLAHRDALSRRGDLQHRLPADLPTGRAAAGRDPAQGTARASRHPAAVLPLGQSRAPVGQRRRAVRPSPTSNSTPKGCGRASATRSTTGCSRPSCSATARRSCSSLQFRPGTNLVTERHQSPIAPPGRCSRSRAAPSTRPTPTSSPAARASRATS